MAGRVDVGIGSDGRPVAVKRASGPTASGRLAREAAALEAARHPGVVELLAATLVGDEPSITTAWVSGGSMEAALDRATPTAVLVDLVADAATTMSELHERGIVHGRLDATHVLIGERGAIITGFAEASTDGQPADDVLALGHLLERLVAAVPASAAHSRLPHRRDANDDRIRHAIARATEPDAALRCPARVLARLLTEESAPHSASARTRVVAPRARALPPLRARARALTATVVAAVLAAVVVITGGFIGSHDGGAAVAVVSTTAVAVTTTVASTSTAITRTSTSTSAPVTSVPPTWPAPPPGCAQLATPHADVDGDGCPDAIDITAGAITTAGHHFVVSIDPSDVIVIGDWDCDGVATPAVLREPSGAIDVVERWPTVGEPTITARRITVIDGAKGIEARPRAEPGCATLAVSTASGSHELNW